jgi:hypothetical protein
VWISQSLSKNRWFRGWAWRIADAKLRDGIGFPAAACSRALSSQGMEILKTELAQGSRNKHRAGVRGRSLKSLESAGGYSYEW